MLARPSNLGLLGLSLVSTLLTMLVLPTGPSSAAERRSTAAAAIPSRTLAVARRQDAPILAAIYAAQKAAVTPRKRAAPRGYRIARLATGRTVKLRSSPGGNVVARIGARTEFGSKRVLAVAEQRGSWLGVTAVERPNGKLAWVQRSTPGLKISRTKVSLHADLSRKSLVVRIGRRNVASMKVAIGRPGSSTPTGRFQVTDKLSGGGYGPYYGCCILALSGKQPNLPAGWKGGNRLAIHGTNAPGAIGKAASAGCLRGSDPDMKLLMRRVPVGTPVFIRS